MIAVVDTGHGNLLSVCNAIEYLGSKAKVCAAPDALLGAERVILPGVGAFQDAMRSLTGRGFPPLLDQLRASGVPILGICLGMQLLARCSYEGGRYAGLGWFDAEVVRLEPRDLRVPHVGWNPTTFNPDSPLFVGLPAFPEFYFVHSYQVRCADVSQVDATCDYGGDVTAAIRLGNVVATQFHPEKSQDLGLAVLDNFLRWNP